MEVAAPMAALLLKTESSGFFSCSFAPLLNNQGLNFAKTFDSETSVRFIPGSEYAFLENGYTDYILRPDELKDVSWFTFVACFEKAKKPKGKSGDNGDAQDEAEEEAINDDDDNNDDLQQQDWYEENHGEGLEPQDGNIDVNGDVDENAGDEDENGDTGNNEDEVECVGNILV